MYTGRDFLGRSMVAWWMCVYVCVWLWLCSSSGTVGEREEGKLEGSGEADNG